MSSILFLTKTLFIFSFSAILCAMAKMPVWAGQPDPFHGKRILWVDSYHPGYEWSDGIGHGIGEILNARGIDWRSSHMNAKNCADAACMQAAARHALQEIHHFKPHVVIASDDIAQQYLVVPFLRGTDSPVVFCGVNWDAGVYGYPAKNVTGMIEVDLIEETVEHLQRYADGERIGYISGDTVSDRKIIEWLNRKFFHGRMAEVRVTDFNMFREKFLELQQTVDMLFIRNYAGIDGWDAVLAEAFLAKHTRIPTASNNDFMAPYVVFTLGKVAEEQGRFAAEAALQIIGGCPPLDIPIAENKQARLTVNLKMADSAGIVLPVSILKIADVIGRETYTQEPSPEIEKKDTYKGHKNSR